MATLTMPRSPRAYLITFHTYGTWLHGDPRGSHNRFHNVPGTPEITPRPSWEAGARRRMKSAPVALDREERVVVHRTLEEVCAHRQWALRAIAVRTEHVHVVIGAPCPPEHVMTALKAWATRRLVEAQWRASGTRVWSRHGSTRYLWSEGDEVAAIDYVLHGQDPAP